MTDFDPVNRPAHYAAGRRFEVIEIIEDWAQFAPDVKQGVCYASALKYLGRLWSKTDGPNDKPEVHLRKAIWYLQRLEQHMTHQRPEEGVDHITFEDVIEKYVPPEDRFRVIAYEDGTPYKAW